MKNARFILSLILLLTSCSQVDDEKQVTGNFTVTVTGSANATLSGSETTWGSSNGELFIRLTKGTEDLVVRVLLDPIVAGTYNVNPILVNQQNQPIVEGDAFGDLNLGSTLTGNRRSFSTNAGNGGAVTVTSVDGDLISGTFAMSLLELLSGGIEQPEVNISGQFTAFKQ